MQSHAVAPTCLPILVRLPLTRPPLLPPPLSYVQEATAALYRGQQAVLGRRPDLAAFQQREEQHAQGLRQLAPGHRARPSLLAPALRAGFWALGAAAAVAPRQLSAAVTAGIHDALTDVCNEQLREMREEGLSEGAPQVWLCTLSYLCIISLLPMPLLKQSRSNASCLPTDTV